MWKMVFKDYKFGAWKKEIRSLLRERLELKDRINYHKKKIEHHENKIKKINSGLLKVEKQLDSYLKKAGNKV